MNTAVHHPLALAAAAVLAATLGCKARESGPPPPGDGEPDRPSRVTRNLRPAVALADRPPARYELGERMEHLRVPGVSVAVMDGGEIAWSRGYGVMIAGERAPVTETTLFQAASISKPVAALAALRLAEQGALDLDRPVNEQLRSWRLPDSPEWPASEVTPRLLLAHGAGLSVHGFPGYSRGAETPKARQILDGAPPSNTEAVRLVRRPGAGWLYSGGGYTVLQVLLEDLTGESFAALAERTVLAPLGMGDSAYRQPLPDRLSSRAARGHDAAGAVIHGGWHTYPELAAAGLWTTPADLARFALGLGRAFTGGPGAVPGPALAREMLSPQVDDWGLGPRLSGAEGEMAFSHGGSNEGFRALLFAYAAGGRGAVVMTNGAQGSQLAGEIMRAVADEYGWPDFRPIRRTAVEPREADVNALAGRYTDGERDPIAVIVEHGVPHLVIGSATPARLYAASRDVLFTLENVEIRLERDAAGGVAVLHGSHEHRRWSAERE